MQLVTGDTKVVDKGKGDGIFVNTAGIGVVEHNLTIAPSAVRPGDVILLSGDVGRHGIAIMAVREGLSFESAIESDCAPLWEPVAALCNAGVEIHCLRDLTRGGLSSGLIEIAETAQVRIEHRRVRRCRCAKMWPAPAKFSAWIRSTWPTKAASSLSCRNTNGTRFGDPKPACCEQRGSRESARCRRNRQGWSR